MTTTNSSPCRSAVLTLLLGLFVGVCIAAGEPANNITVVYNHVQSDSAPGLETGGGFSALVKFDGKSILFDTGGETSLLLRNMEKLEQDTSEIDAIIISHNHWDHVYGLPGVLSVTSDSPPVYVPQSNREAILQQIPWATVVEVDKPTEIMPRVWVVGPMRIEYRSGTLVEQALVLDHKDGLVVLVGCSHPGIVAIIERVKELFDDKEIMLVGGGFHLRRTPQDEVKQIASSLRQLGIKKLAPSHCTGDGAIDLFRQEWGEQFVSFRLGESFLF